MSIRALVIGVTLLASVAFAQTPEPQRPAPNDAMTRAQMEASATALVNEGKFDEAIAAFKTLLTADPADERVKYELGVAYAAHRDFGSCKTTLAPLAGNSGPRQVQLIGMLAYCVDGLGDYDGAVATYQRGLAVAPDDPQLRFNLAVTLAKRGSLDEARGMFEHETRTRPGHATAHYLLAQVFEAQGLNVPALFGYLRFLSFEPSSKRAALAAARTQGLLNGVVRKTEVPIDAAASPAEGDYKPLQLALAMSSAGGSEGDSRLTLFQRTQEQLAANIDMFLDLSATDHTDYTAVVQRPFFAELRKEGLIEPFTAVTLSSLHLAGAEEWAKKNGKTIERYYAWIKPRTEGMAAPAKP
jgi:tetratricopeptide (TPR) repeat protein